MRKVFCAWVQVSLIVLMSVGCGNSEFAPVSGTVIFDGQPIENVLVVFTPRPDGGNHAPGPYSTGTTDSEGQFVVKTKSGDRGAVRGPHKVGFTWADYPSIESQVISEKIATASLNELSTAEVKALKKQLKEVKARISSRPRINQKAEILFEVPEDGTTDANFDLSKTETASR